MRLGVRVGRGCARPHHYRAMGLRVGRLELDELWSYVGKKQRRTSRKELEVKGDQYVFTALASVSKAIVTTASASVPEPVLKPSWLTSASA